MIYGRVCSQLTVLECRYVAIIQSAEQKLNKISYLIVLHAP